MHFQKNIFTKKKFQKDAYFFYKQFFKKIQKNFLSKC